MQKIVFTKMQGLGNDFIVLDARTQKIRISASLIQQWSDRHFGIGADQLLLIEPSQKADAKMLVYNADGEEAEMCGNGIRCVASYLHGNGASSTMRLETKAGILSIRILKDAVEVDMGEPILEGEKIPITRRGRCVAEPLEVDGKTFEITCVSMGNPHCVIFEEKEGQWDAAHWGPLLERHPLFPKRTNVEFVFVRSLQEITARVWERGAGMTLACGTGACASAVAAVLNGKTQRKVKVHLLGGELEVEWDKSSGHVWLRGPSKEVYRGEIEIKE